MSRSVRSIRGNLAWSLIGQGGHAGLQWAVLIVIAQLAGPSPLGEFSLALAVTSPVFMFFAGQLTFSQATDAVRRFSTADYFSARVFGALLGLACSSALAIIWFERAFASVFFIALARSLELIGEIGQGSLQHQERFRRSSVLLLARGSLGLVGSAVGVYVTDGAWGPAAGYAMGRAISAIVEISTTLSGTAISLYTPQTRNLLLASLPLSATSLIISLQVSAPRLIIEHFHGTAELGVYAAVSYLTVVGNTALQATISSLGPRMARAYSASNLRSLNVLIGGAVSIAGILGVAGVAFALMTDDALLVFLYGSAFAGSGKLFMLAMCSCALHFVSSAIRQVLVSLRVLRFQVSILCFSFALNLALLLHLVPADGAIGAAWSSVVSTFAQLAAFVGLLAAFRRASLNQSQQLNQAPSTTH